MQNSLSSFPFLLFTLLLLCQTSSVFSIAYGSFQIDNFRRMTQRNLDNDRNQNFASDYIDLMAASDYYGRWTSSDTTVPPGLKNPEGLAVLNPYETGADIVLLDSEYIDRSFYFIFFNYKDVFKGIRAKNGKMKVVNREIRYWKGDDLLRQGNVSAEECVIKEMTVSVRNAATDDPFNPLEDKKRDGVIKIKVVGGDCPFNFETSDMTPYDERFQSQRWIYSLIYLVWCVPNIIVGLKKFRDLGNIDPAQGAQFFLIFNINFYLSMWNNAFAQELAGTSGLILVALINLFIWSCNFGTSFRCVQRRHKPYFLVGGIFFTIIMRIIYTISHGVLLTTFIAIVLIDIIRHYKIQDRFTYNMSLYLGIISPSLVSVAYLTLYNQNFARISTQPELTKFFVIFLFLAFCVLPLQLERKRFIRKIQREKRFINVKDINPEDVCPICVQSLVPVEQRNDTEEQTEAIFGPKDNEKQQLNPVPVEIKPQTNQPASRVFKTECRHLFHENCLSKWIQIKSECPTCARPIVDFI